LAFCCPEEGEFTEAEDSPLFSAGLSN